MKKRTVTLVVIIGAMLISACQPSTQAIQEAIEKTQMAELKLPTVTLPTPTEKPMTYEQAVQAYHTGDFEKAAEYFRNNMQIEDSESYLEKCEVMISAQGGWIHKRLDCKLHISGWAGIWEKIDSWTLEIVPVSFRIQPENVTNEGFLFDMVREKGEWTMEYVMADEVIGDIYAGGEYSRSNLASLTGPTIGMTAQQVVNSAWGRPDKINKTVTERGTREQWVYDFMFRDSNAYVYLENGIVTSISY